MAGAVAPARRNLSHLDFVGLSVYWVAIGYLWQSLATLILPALVPSLVGFSNFATAGSGVIARFIAGGLLDDFNAGPPILGLKGGYPVIFTVFLVWLVAGSLAILKVREPGR